MATARRLLTPLSSLGNVYLPIRTEKVWDSWAPHPVWLYQAYDVFFSKRDQNEWLNNVVLKRKRPHDATAFPTWALGFSIHCCDSRTLKDCAWILSQSKAIIASPQKSFAFPKDLSEPTSSGHFSKNYRSHGVFPWHFAPHGWGHNIRR